MALILAIEPDRRQAAKIAASVRGRLDADLVIEGSAEAALPKLAGRVPDLVLTTALLAPKDDAALAAWLRELGASVAWVQTLTIPVLGSSSQRQGRGGGMLSMLRRGRAKHEPDGCDPAVFADQVADYLARAAREREEMAELLEYEEEIAAAASAAEPASSVALPEPDPAPDAWSVQRQPDLTPAAEPSPVIEEVPAADETLAASTPIAEYQPIAVAAPIVAEYEPIAVVAPIVADDEPIAVVTPLVADDEPIAVVAPLVADDEPIAVVTPLVADDEPIAADEAPIAADEPVVPIAAAADEASAAVAEIVAFAGGMPAAKEGHAVEEPVLEEPAVAETVVAEAAPVLERAPEPREPRAPRAPREPRIPEWVGILESLRRDVETLRAAERPKAPLEPLPPIVLPKATPIVARPESLPDPVPSPRTAVPDTPPARSPERAPVSPAPVRPATPSVRPVRPRMRRRLPHGPVQDEWGLFDPEQCGFAALLAKLKETTLEAKDES